MTRSLLDATDVPDIGQPREAHMRSDGDAEDSLIQVAAEPVDGPNMKSKIEMLAFMEERVVVRIHKSADKFAENPVPLWNGGRPVALFRGQPTVVKRKYVEVLARAKTSTYEDVEDTDRRGVRYHRYPKQTALQYPFEVLEDRNPLGKPWLEKILQEG